MLLPLPFLSLFTLTLLTIYRSHLLMSLLMLEATILLLTLFTALSLSMSSQPNTFFIAILLTMGACEASVGLALLVAMTRTYGSDLVSSLSINKC